MDALVFGRPVVEDMIVGLQPGDADVVVLVFASGPAAAAKRG